MTDGKTNDAPQEVRVCLGGEREIASALRPILQTADVGNMLNFVEQDHEFFDDLGSFMVDVLSEVYQEHRAWVGEYLDLVTPRAARKIGERNAEIMGLCLPTWNRGVLPFHVRLQIAEHDDFVRWCECRVGEKGCDGRLLKGDWDSSDRVINQMYVLDGNPSAIDWFYKATFGDRG